MYYSLYRAWNFVGSYYDYDGIHASEWNVMEMWFFVLVREIQCNNHQYGEFWLRKGITQLIRIYDVVLDLFTNWYHAT